MKHLKLFFALFAMLALGVGNAWGAEWEKVTSAPADWSGEYLLVYESGTTAYVWTGVDAAKCSTQGTISSNKITGDFVSLTIATMTGGYSIKVNGGTNNGKYIYGTNNSNKINFGTTANANTLTYESNSTKIVSNTSVMRFNSASSDLRFRYYKSSSFSSQKAVQLYKKVEQSEGGAVTEDLGDALKWSATSATVQMGADDNEYPTLTNDKNVAVTYTSSSEAVATIDANGVVTPGKEGTTTISAYYEGGEIDGVTYSAKNVSYTLTVKPAPLVIEPIEGGIIDILTHKIFASTGSYTNFSGKQATNDNHSDAVYAGKTARNGSATQYSIQLNTIGTGRIATTTTGGLAKRVYVRWATQGTLNTNNRSLYIYGSNDAFTGSETSTSATKIGTITFTTGATEAYVDLTSDYKYILMTGSGAIYMDEIQVTWVSAAGTVVTPTIHGDAEFVESTEVSISTEDGYKVYYTLDGTEPTNASTEYTSPFTVNATTIVKAVAYDGAIASDVVSTTLKKLQSLTCAEAAELCTSTESADKYVIRGYVTSIPYPYSQSNTSPTFWMADTKNGGEVMYAYKVTPVEEADKAVAVGDQVQVIGKIKLYSGKKEVNTGIYTITALNPKYNVNITSAHGTATATPASAVEGTEITLSVEVETGWVFQSWTVTDASSNTIEVTDNKFTMPASDVTVVANYTESVADDAVLKLSANGVETSNTYKVGETVKLPETIVNDCVKMFVGWSADANCATDPEYAPGADFELTAAEHTLYAVYANGTTGETVTIKHNLPSDSQAKNLTGNNDAATYFNLDASKWSIKGSKGGHDNNVGLNKDGTIRLYYHENGVNTLTITAPSKVATVQLSCVNNYNQAWVKVNGNKVTPTDGVYTIDAETFVIGNAYTTSTQLRINSITVTLAGALADFSTTCSGALAAPTFSVAEGEYTEAKSITLSAAEGTIYYTLDGTAPTSASDVYSEAIVLDKCGEYTIKAIAISSDSESPVASATYTISLPIPANDADNPYTGTEAIEVYNGGCYDGSTLVYVTGTVQEVEYSSSYGNYEITFADGFQCYRLQKTADAKFTEDVIGAGDVIVACGKLDKFGSNYQLAAGCYLVKHTPSVKADAELAWNPETVTLTVGDAFAAPTLQYPNDITGTITYESSNEDVATVSAAGVIDLVDDAVGTATITASFLGDATYKPATATCTIQVKPVQEDCEGSDDFETLEVNNGYATRTTTGGWKATHAAVAEIEGSNYIIINGKKSEVGTITSPVLNGGLGSIKIRYANTYSESNGVSFRLDIKQDDEVVKTYTITYKTGITQNTVYTELIENINVAGEFQMVFTNLSPSNSTSNKDRVSIGRLCWTGYEIPKYTITTTAEKGTVTGAGVYVAGDKVTLTADPAMDYTFVSWTKGGEVVSTANPFVFEATENLDLVANFTAISQTSKTLTGEFSVGQYEVAQFATGNLQYTNGTWGFAKQQYQYVGEANINVGDPTFTGTIDMFGWSTNETNYGVDPRNVNEFYDGEFVDWGDLFPVEDNWSTLSADQWKYLLNTRTNASSLKQIARVGSVVGIMLFPDVWNAPLTVTAQRDSYFEVDIHNYTLEQWAELEEAGALFLPAAGRRTGGYGNMINYDQQVETREDYLVNGGFYRWKDNTNIYCYYWTSTINEDKNVSYLHNIVDLGNDEYTIGTGAIWGEKGRYGQSVRLAKVTSTLIEIGDGNNSEVIEANEGEKVNVKVNRTFKANDGYYTICLPFNIDADEIGKAYQVTSITEHVAEEGFFMVFDEVETLIAGQPYLILPKNLTNPIFENVTIVNTTGETVEAEGAGIKFDMVGVINGGGKTDHGQYWVGDNGCFYDGDGTPTDKLGLRVLFNITDSQGQPVKVRARVVLGENTTTGLDNITNGEDTTIKVIENGQLIIIRDGIKYNAQGQRL